MHVLVSGARGLVGSALVPLLESQGHRVSRLVRREPCGTDEVSWDPKAGIRGARAIEPFDAVIHLAGESIAGGRWSGERMRRIRESRVDATHRLVESLGRMPNPPRVFISASAVGYYGDRADEELTEGSAPGRGFLAELATDWEAAAHKASEFPARVVCLRTGIALASTGGALAPMLIPFRLGLGGPIGNGRAWWSWIALGDLARVYTLALTNDAACGSLNAVAPAPVRVAEFTRILARVLGRPAFFRVPAFVLRAVLGRMADEALLASARVLPRRLAELGFEFRDPELEGALRSLLLATP